MVPISCDMKCFSVVVAMDRLSNASKIFSYIFMDMLAHEKKKLLRWFVVVCGYHNNLTQRNAWIKPLFFQMQDSYATYFLDLYVVL